MKFEKGKFIFNVYKYTVNILFFIMVLYLWLVCGFNTCWILYGEHTLFVKDNFVVNSIFLCMMVFLLIYIERSNKIKKLLLKMEEEKLFLKAKKILLFLIFLAGMVIVLSFRVIPKSDQASVMNAAYNLKIGNYTAFQENGYISMHHNQIGLMWFWYGLSFFFGDKNYIIFQIINVVALVNVYKQLTDIAELLNLRKIGQVLLLCFGLIYFPMTLYSTFAYGNMLGLSLALLSMKYEFLFLKDRKQKDAIRSVLFIVAAIILRENYLIFMIAMIIYASVKLLNIRDFKIIIFILCIISGVVLQGVVLKGILEIKTGEKLVEGVSPWAYIAMGLHENDVRCDGWWDKSNTDTYIGNDSDTNKQKEVAIADIKDILRTFARNKGRMYQFFGKKLASQWNNPTFQGFWVNQGCNTDINQSQWVKDFQSIQYSNKLIRLIDKIEFCVWFGAILFMLFSKEKKDLGYLFLQVIFIGGFLFHIFWEAKGQYTWPYFIIIVPLSLNGYLSLVQNIPYKSNVSIKSMFYKNALQCVMIAFVIVILPIVIGISDITIFNSFFKLDWDTAEYERILKDNHFDRISKGMYSISPLDDSQSVLFCVPSADNVNEGKVYIENVQEHEPSKLRLQYVNGGLQIQFADDFLCLDLHKNDIETGLVHAYRGNGGKTQEWYLRKAKERDAYYILKDSGYALTYDLETGSVGIGMLEYGNNQKWIIK